MKRLLRLFTRRHRSGSSARQKSTPTSETDGLQASSTKSERNSAKHSDEIISDSAVHDRLSPSDSLHSSNGDIALSLDEEETDPTRAPQDLATHEAPQPLVEKKPLNLDDKKLSEPQSKLPYALSWTKHKLELTPVRLLDGRVSNEITRNPFPLYGNSCSVLPTSIHECLIFGGFKGFLQKDQPDDLDLFLLSTDKMTLTGLVTNGAKPDPGGNRISTIIGRTLVAVGGNHSYLHFLDIDTRKWSKYRPPFPFPRDSSDFSISVVGNSLWLYGGISRAIAQSELWCLELDNFSVMGTVSWRQVPQRDPWPVARLHHSAVCHGSSIYIFGGQQPSDNGRSWLRFNDIWEFNTETEGWIEVQCNGIPPPRCSGHAATILGDNMFVYGGYIERDNSATQGDEAFVFNIPSCRWQSLGMLVEGRSPERNMAFLAVGSKLVVVGGNDSSNEPSIHFAEIQYDLRVDSLAGLHFTTEETNLKFKTEAVDLSRFIRKRGEAAHSLAGFSDVWKGEMTETGDPIAIKVLRVVNTNYPSDPKRSRLRKRFDRELSIWMKCQHPRVLALLGYAYIEGIPCLISPWCSNGDIMEYLSRHRTANRLQLVIQVAEGLVYLHGRNPSVIHSDVKPTNVLISDTGDAKICDFGISKLMMETPSGFTTTKSANWTLRYSAKELLCEGANSTMSDVFAFGMLILEVMTNKAPFFDITVEAMIVVAIMNGRVPSPDDYPELPATDPLWEIMRECWNEEPSKRPTMVEVLEKLRKYAQAQDVQEQYKIEGKDV